MPPMMMMEVITAAVTDTQLLIAIAAATIAASTITNPKTKDINEPIGLFFDGGAGSCGLG